MYPDDHPRCVYCNVIVELPRVFTPIICESCRRDAART
jgi:hypothetical protein